MTAPSRRAFPCGQVGTEAPLVLIVDDNQKNMKLARDVLRAAGFRTLEGASGAEGIALAEQHLPDVILMDIGLPDMDGTTAARKLREVARTDADSGRRAQRATARRRTTGFLPPASPATSRSRSASARSRTRCAATARVPGHDQPRRVDDASPSGVPAPRPNTSGHGWRKDLPLVLLVVVDADRMGAPYVSCVT